MDKGAVPWLEGVPALPLCVQNLVIVSVLPMLGVDKGVGQGCHMVGEQGGMEQGQGGLGQGEHILETQPVLLSETTETTGDCNDLVSKGKDATVL